jgi:hypothetical protein
LLLRLQRWLRLKKVSGGKESHPSAAKAAFILLDLRHD